MMFMFSRFTERAQQVLVLAQEGPKDWVIVLLGQSTFCWAWSERARGLPARALQNMNVDLNGMRSEVERITRDKLFQKGVSYTRGQNGSWKLSIEESQNLGHNMWALSISCSACCASGIAAQVFTNLGII